MLIARKELMFPLFVAPMFVLSVGAPEDVVAAVGECISPNGRAVMF